MTPAVAQFARVIELEEDKIPRTHDVTGLRGLYAYVNPRGDELVLLVTVSFTLPTTQAMSNIEGASVQLTPAPPTLQVYLFTIILVLI
jgi:hypothetical protein